VHGAYPLLVTGHYPAGRTLFVGMDSTWLWRFHFGDVHHERFWRNAIRWLAIGRLKSGDRRYQVETGRSSYGLGERVPVEARVLDEDFKPSEAPVQPVRWSGPDGRPRDLELPAVPGRPGLYRGTLEPEEPGTHRVWIEDGERRVTGTEFEIVLPSRENREPAPDPDLLRELAALSGGRLFELADVRELARVLPGGEERREPLSSRLDDLWDAWGTLILALLVLSAEWILRKRVELV